jgi:hypothetical protein
MNIVIALLTSKTAIMLTLVVAAYQSLMSASTPLLIGLWGLFAATVVGRAVRQYNQPEDNSTR